MASLEFRNITKIFPGVRALDGMSFVADSGEVVALLGENGAGKSTLLKVLNGDYQADGGEYLLDGTPQKFRNPLEAIDAGISVIYQERQMVPYLSVAENIFMEALPKTRFGTVDNRMLNREAQKIIDLFRLPIRATDKVRTLSVAHQQMVEIMKAYRRHPKVIAFDEPTASLSDAEIDILFDVIRQLRSEGLIILYVSHRMAEIFRITDQVVVFKDGRFVKQLATKDTTEKELIRLMVGRDLGDVFAGLNKKRKIGDVILDVQHLTNPWITDVSFQLRKGEILGFAGLVGAGRTETVRAVFGADPVREGTILLDGKSVRFSSPKQAIESGLGLVTEDRKDQGIFGVRSVMDNINVAALKKVSRGIVLNSGMEHEAARKAIKKLAIKTPDEMKKVGELSGGNQQKVIFARWLQASPKVLILDEPTKGIDVGAKAEIYQIACDLAEQGIGVIFISSELPEILGVCDRILVMHDGRITGELDPEKTNEEEILSYAMMENRRE